MANTQYVTANRLTTEAGKARKRVLLFGTPVVVILCLVFPGIWWWFLAAFLIIVLNTGSIKRAGAEGEDSTLKLLSSLPDSYTVMNQVNIPNKESRTGHTELDFIVVGPNGVFVIEVKNNNSKIIGTEHDREWVVHKVGRKGTPYTASMRNPIKQLKSQIWALGNFTKERGHKAWIEGIVFFSNPDSSFEFRGEPSVPILHNSGLTDYILNYKPRHAIKNPDKIVQDLATIKQTANA